MHCRSGGFDHLHHRVGCHLFGFFDEYELAELLIEIVQGLPMVHRDKDFWDWVADTLAIVAALSPMLLVPWRGAVRSGVATLGAKAPRATPPGQKNIDI